MVRVVLSADLNPISPAKASPTRSVKTGLAGSASMAATTSRVCSTRCVAATNGSQRPRCSRCVSMAVKMSGASSARSGRNPKSSGRGIAFMAYCVCPAKDNEFPVIYIIVNI